jgi:hypothetical protein
MALTRIRLLLGTGILTACAVAPLPFSGWSQQAKKGAAAAQRTTAVPAEQPDAQRTRAELSNLLQRYRQRYTAS